LKTILLFLIIFFTFSNASSPGKNVTLQLSWLHQFQFAGYYIAKEKGFYKRAGLNVTIKEYKFGLNLNSILHEEKSDFVVGKTSFIVDKIAGKEIVALAAIFQHSPLMLLVREDSNIKDAGDLRGKKVMITSDAKNTAAILAMLNSQQLDLDDINVQKHSFKLEDLISGKTDAMASYESNEPLRLQNMNIKYKMFHPKNYGFDFYNGMLFTTQKNIDNNPDNVKAFHDATIKGWKYAFENIEESAKLIFTKYNTQNKSLDDFIEEGKVLKTLAYDGAGNIGTLNKQRLKEIANVFLVMGLINRDYTLDGFMYEYNTSNKNKIYLTKNEMQWLKKHPRITYGGSDWAPIHSSISSNASEGIAEDILKLILKKLTMGMSYEKQESWNKALSKIKNKTLDVGLATSESSQKREYGIFTKSYVNFPLVIASSSDVAFISSTDELNNKVVAVGKNFTAHNFLKEFYPKIKILALKNSDEALMAVSSGRAYAMVDILPVVAHKIRKLNLHNLKISGTTDYSFHIKSLVRDDYPLLVSILNKGIDSLSKDEIQDVINKWSSIEYVSQIDYNLLVKVILFFTIVIIILSYLQNRRLKMNNKKLEETLKNLKETREDLIASEKMATLGELVGGVTHEIISPLSVGIMGSSYIVDMTEEIDDLYNRHDMSEGDFKDYINDVRNTSKSITLNLNRTKLLVNSFKDVAVDQAIEDIRDFSVKMYIDEILLSMTSKLKQTNIKIDVLCDEKLVIKSHPGYIAQILINFINNSLIHAFKEKQEGTITISMQEINKHLVFIYKDNGRGVDLNVQNKVFDEFYTTKKGKGGTGLGLYIVKTIVECKLKGTLSFSSVKGEGIEFKVAIPL